MEGLRSLAQLVEVACRCADCPGSPEKKPIISWAEVELTTDRVKQRREERTDIRDTAEGFRGGKEEVITYPIA
ncbi:hypothetical protein NDU88_000716 [Pleurodeles waltl]|uniref:Uncharacterized protein n=1 Tax=Pleurodeles waltl TaxID=8319 RepID=A0AAV7VX19_PLEWA|nr:hypothetical protein NDU88_000716 [Pleurodeles waltl]